MPDPRPNIQKLAAYTPGEQPDTAKVTKLNTNESPYPPSPKAMDALRDVPAELLRVYPPPLAQPFRAAAAEVHGLSPDQVIATNGGDELLRLLITCYCKPADGSGASAGGLGVTTPSYSLYPVLAAIHDTPVCTVEREADFALPGDLAKRWNDAGCTLAMLVNPHAPTGRYEAVHTLRAIADRFNGLLVIDEAYTNFAEDDALDLVRDGVENVLLLRSMSKGYGLAGLRFGYGLGHAGVITALDKARDSYNTDIVSQRVATAALRDQPYAQDVWRRVIDARAALAAALHERGFAVLDSQTNFLLATPPGATAGEGADKPAAPALYAALKERGILVRYFDLPRLDDKLRITVGTPQQNTALLEALDELM